jgi:hypothetical protein
MLSILDVLSNIFFSKKKIDIKTLPSGGFFYNEDLTLSIKRASESEIKEYHENFTADDLVSIISKIKKIVCNNVILNEPYIFEDLKSVDVVFIFLEIVKHTTGNKIMITYVDEQKNKECQIEFDKTTFNYFKPSTELMTSWNKKERHFDIMGYRYNLPTIGVENCITFFLLYHSQDENSPYLSDLFYDFTYFVGQKNFLTFNEIENLIQVFNSDIEEEEMDKIKEILEIFSPFQKYSLIEGGKVVDINSKIDLKNIWL